MPEYDNDYMQKQTVILQGSSLGFDNYHSQTLIQLGLTPNQARMYLCLLGIGKATGSSLSRETSLARQEVYRILHELHDIGLVEKIISSPNEFQAVPIQDGISVLMMEKAKELEQTKERIKSLIDEYSFMKGTIPKKEFKFLLIPPKKLVNETRERMLEGSTETIKLITTNKRLTQGVSHFFETYERTLQKKVDVQIIVVGEKTNLTPPNKLKLLLQYPNLSLKFTVESSVNMLIVDNNEAIVTLYPTVDLGASPVLWTNHPEFLTLYQSYFGDLWDRTDTNRRAQQ